MRDVTLVENERRSSVFYRIAVKSFFDSDGDGIGDLQGLQAKLPYFSFLGVDSVILADWIETDHFGVTDYRRVDPSIGSNEDLAELLAAMHNVGLRAFLSITPHYTSFDHPWFEKSRSASDLNPYRDYYIWKESKDPKRKDPPDNRRNDAKESVWHRDQNGSWYFADHGEERPSLNYDNPRLRKEMMETIRFWREMGVDGLVIEDVRLSKRANVVGDSPRYSNYEEYFEVGAQTYRFLREVAERFSREFPIVLNVKKVDPALFSLLLEGDQRVADMLILDRPIEETGIHAFSFKKFSKEFISLQDKEFVDRIGSPFEDDTHDRLLSKVSKGKECVAASKMLGALLLTAATIPVIYQGEEIGMTDLPKRIAERESAGSYPNARSPFQWDSKANAGFSLATFPYLPINENYREINCMVESADPNSTLAFYRKLIAFRQGSPALLRGAFRDRSDGDVVAYTRSLEEETLLVVANTHSRNINYHVPADLFSSASECLLSSYALVGKTLHPSIGLRPYEVRVYRLPSSN